MENEERFDKTKFRNEEFLKSFLSHSSHVIVFEKNDGSIRTMNATRDKSLITVEPKNNKTRKINEDYIPVFDLDIQEWRSFNIDSLIFVDGLKL